jgi:DNA-binding transcriptional ArsR family regulator
MFEKLDPLLHNQLRLGIVSLLVGLESAEFKWLKEQTGATAGNISIQLKKLEEAGYITIRKSFKGNYPNTTCSITKQGSKAFESYVQSLKGYLRM